MAFGRVLALLPEALRLWLTSGVWGLAIALLSLAERAAISWVAVLAGVVAGEGPEAFGRWRMS